MEDPFETFCSLDVEPSRDPIRPHCEQCQRPETACWCPWLPKTRLSIRTHILILQHPYEERRRIRTARILELAIDANNVHLVRSKKFNQHRCPELLPILSAEDSYILFPYRDSIPAHECIPNHSETATTDSVTPRWLVVLDGTWTQARHMLTGSPLLMAMKRVCLPADLDTGITCPSEFIVRRQPFSGAVCTVEAVARILDLWEPPDSCRPDDFYRNQLLPPLHRICQVQTAWKQEELDDETDGQEYTSTKTD